jgi:LPXTG-site transpeptidase (sortase) family protein
MGTNNFFKSANFYILAGLLILVVSSVGIFGMAKQNSAKIEKSTFRYYTKALPTFNPILPASNGSATVEPFKAESDVTPTQIQLDPKKNFIDSALRPELSHPNIPTRIVISKIKLDAPVIVTDFNYTNVEGETFGQWQAPNEFAAGWHPDSALLGEMGNTVINGHHNAYGEVFGKLVDLNPGDVISVYAGDREFKFIIANRMILPERFEDAETRLENARWLARSEDYRLTLVTCWPKETNTHRLILVARPLEEK